MPTFRSQLSVIKRLCCRVSAVKKSILKLNKASTYKTAVSFLIIPKIFIIQFTIFFSKIIRKERPSCFVVWIE